MDAKFTQAMQEWLNADSGSRSLVEGAELLLRINRNRWMYMYILRRGDEAKLEYELRKHLQIRLDGLTRQDVARMEKTVLREAKESVDAGQPVIDADKDRPQTQPAIGKRADHDRLPEDIQELYVRNGDVYFKMKNIFEELKKLRHAQPCDRYELLKQLGSLDKEYRANWQKYDAAKVVEEEEKEEKKPAPKKRKKKEE